MSRPPIYCIDSSSLINLQKFPRVVFEGPWAKLEELIEEGRLIAPIQVKTELTAKSDDEIEQWVKHHAQMFIEIDNDQGAFIAGLYQ